MAQSRARIWLSSCASLLALHQKGSGDMPTKKQGSSIGKEQCYIAFVLVDKDTEGV
jgi:hypothetical protein